MSRTPPRCRLSVLLARNAPVGLIFRRGPKKWTQLIRWDTETDTFEPGAWFEGTIYPDYCDISPDGTLLLYRASNRSMRNRLARFPETWTAISKLPWVTTLALWSTYEGGGFFQTNTKVWVNAPKSPLWVVHVADDDPNKPSLPPQIKAGFHWFGDLATLLWKRRGWKTVENSVRNDTESEDFEYRFSVLEKKAPDSRFSLLRTHARYLRAYYPTDTLFFERRNNRNNRRTHIEGAKWADWDQRGRIVYTNEGKLFTAEITDSGEMVVTELADFTNAKPERTRSPDWARHW